MLNPRRLKRASLLACGLPALFAATALASGANSVHVHVAKTVQAHVAYPVKLRGHAAQNSTLYVFLDNLGCLRSPAAEHKRGANGYVWNLTPGDFAVKAKGNTPFRGQNHACAYLAKGIHYHPGSPPGNPRHGIVAHSFETFTVQ